MNESPNGPSLREYTETRFNLLIEQMKNMGNRFDEQLREIDVRYSQRFQAQMEAVSKADQASERRFDSVNEFRQTLTDQTATFLQKNEWVQSNIALSDRISKVENLVAGREGKYSGVQENKNEAHSATLLWISGLMMVISLLALVINFLSRKGP